MSKCMHPGCVASAAPWYKGGVLSYCFLHWFKPNPIAYPWGRHMKEAHDLDCDCESKKPL